MSEIDWSKAPEATHWTPSGTGFHEAFWRFDGERFTGAWVIERGEVVYYPNPIGPLRKDRLVEKTAEKSWSGAGLPPVGTVCEYYIDDGKWRQCEVVAHKDGYAVIWITAAHVFSSRSCGLLRPLRTPEQIEAEEREKAVRELSAIISSKIIDRSAAVAIYEAGYRKQGEAK